MVKVVGSFTGEKQRALGVRPLYAALLAAALVASTLSQDNNPDTASSTAPTAAANAPSASSNSEVLQDPHDYFASVNRNALLKEAVQTAGTKIVEASMTGQTGSFDFHNVTNGEGQGSAPATAGWGWLQTGLQETDHLAVFVYRNNDGTFDTSKGIHGLVTRVADAPTLSFSSPSISELVSPDYGKSSGWEVTIKSRYDGTVASAQATADTSTAAAVRDVDGGAIYDLAYSMNEIGLIELPLSTPPS